MFRVGSAFLLAICALPVSGAPPREVNSVEWLASRADVVVTGTILASRAYLDMTEVDVGVTRTLKGPPKPGVTFVYESIGDSGPKIGSLRGEQLFFLLRGLNIPPDRRHDFKAWERLTLQEREVNVIPFGQLKSAPAFSCTFRLLRDVDEIAVAINSNSAPTGAQQALTVKPPPGSPAFDILGSDPYAIVRVPDDDRWKLPYLQYLTNTPRWWIFLRNARRLRTPETVALMTALLNDSTWEHDHVPHWNHSIPSFDFRNYTGRRVAHDILVGWGAHPTNLTLQEPLLPVHQFPRELMFAPLVFVPLLILPRRTSLPRRLYNLATLISTLAVIFLCGMVIRSRFYYDDVIFATRAAQHEFFAFEGRLQYLVVNDLPEPHKAIYRSTNLHDPRALPDHIGYLYPAKSAAGFGVDRTTGVTPRDEESRRFPYHLTRVSFSTLLIPALVLPGLRLVSYAIRRLTARIRRSRNRCPNCGYDLGFSPNQCPECGRLAKVR
jgi:hypothetical protein